MTVKRQYGFSLMEVLVSLLILSVGLLGLAGLQITGLRSVGLATNYTQATLAINDIAERMRANPTAVDDNVFLNVDSNAASFATTIINCANMPNPYCSAYYNTAASSGVNAVACTPAELASYDLNIWFCGEALDPAGANRAGPLSASLPQAQVSIGCNDNVTTDADACTAGSPHTISINWQDQNPDNYSDAGASIARNLTMTIQP